MLRRTDIEGSPARCGQPCKLPSGLPTTPEWSTSRSRQHPPVRGRSDTRVSIDESMGLRGRSAEVPGKKEAPRTSGENTIAQCSRAHVGPLASIPSRELCGHARQIFCSRNRASDPREVGSTAGARKHETYGHSGLGPRPPHVTPWQGGRRTLRPEMGARASKSVHASQTGAAR